ncbi:hypothetical protein [Rubritalea tangerina]|uniref:hypothetical protein n=1 Tax=Rubritalea tangerina TaxID=430798 RepID=UPI003617A47F
MRWLSEADEKFGWYTSSIRAGAPDLSFSIMATFVPFDSRIGIRQRKSDQRKPLIALC